MAVLVGLGIGVLMLRTYLERDSRFRITGTDAIQAAGLTEVSRPEMLTVFGEDVGRNVFFISLSERRRQLEQLPWVEHATVMRLLPDRIRVSVVERRPVAFTRHGNEIGLVDANGVLLSMPASAMARHHYSFPVVTGIDAGDTASARQKRMAVYQRLMAELGSGGRRATEQLSEIDMTDPEDARVTMPEQGGDILAHFGDDRFLERFERYRTHIAEWKQQYPHLASVDLRYDQQVVLEMNPGKGTADAVAGDAGTAQVAEGKAPLTAKGKPSAVKKQDSARLAKTAGVTTAKQSTSSASKKSLAAKKTALSASKRKTVKKPVKPASQKKRAASGAKMQGGG